MEKNRGREVLIILSGMKKKLDLAICLDTEEH